MRVSRAIYAFGLLLLPACGLDLGGGGSRGADPQFSGQPVQLISAPGALRNQNGILQGTGTSLFRQPLNGVNTSVSYEVEFTLQDGGEVVLISHGNANLDDAFQVRFSRRGFGRNSLGVILQAGGSTRPSPELFANVDASLPLRFQIDIHNDEGALAHVMIWNINFTRDVFIPATAALNTLDPARSNYGSPGRGQGDRWGLQLQNASVARSFLSAAKFPD